MSQPVHDRAELLARLNGRRVVASISGGKDSAAMSLYLRELGIEHDRVFMDTGWEAAVTYEYIRGPLTEALGPIETISSPHKMVSTILRKGMFPSRQRRFCTQELKVFPMQRYLAARVERGEDVVNAVGIRHGESAARSKMAEWEWSDGFDCEVWRPLIDWTEQDVIDIHHRHGLRPNRLYLAGASRVGCWPCIFARKSEIRLIAETDPARIDLIERVEQRVEQRATRRYATRGETFESLGYIEPGWFQNPMPDKRPCADCAGGEEPPHGPAIVCPECLGDGMDPEDELEECRKCIGEGEIPPRCWSCNGRGTRRMGKPWPIRKVVEWARTSRGGRQVELFAAPAGDTGCMRWGLCDTADDGGGSP